MPARRLGTASIIAKLLAKGWIEGGSAARTYKITAAGKQALQTPLPIRTRRALD
jgi:predicted MarR family transcription regulator